LFSTFLSYRLGIILILTYSIKWLTKIKVLSTEFFHSCCRVINRRFKILFLAFFLSSIGTVIFILTGSLKLSFLILLDFLLSLFTLLFERILVFNSIISVEYLMILSWV
jgi:hypothetical protein